MIAHTDGQTALPRHGPVGHGAIDRAGQRLIAGGINDHVLKPPIDHQRRGCAPTDMVQQNDPPLHFVPQTGQPAAANTCAVSAKGRPTMAV